MGLHIEHVSKRFENSEHFVLKDINLDIQDGEFVCIIGPSGCGKSTLVNLIAGLDKPSQGVVTLDGEQIMKPGSDRAVMFQEDALYPWLNVIDNVKFGLKAAGLPKEEQEKRAMHYLNMVHLAKFRSYRIHELSGGMKRRVALARALAIDSKMIIMDEPFSALDKQTINMLLEEVQEICKSIGKTIVFVTHSVEEAILLGDRIVVMGSNPGHIKQILPVGFQRPRRLDDLAFINMRIEILRLVRNEVLDSVEKQYEKIQ